MHAFDDMIWSALQPSTVSARRTAGRSMQGAEASNDRRDAAVPGAGIDFSRVAIRRPTCHDDLLGAGPDAGGATPAPAEPVVDEAQALAGAPKVDLLNVITGKTGAFSGFPVAKGIDLNVPGPFNDTTTTGSCVNVHQMQFHLSRGDPADVKLIRKVVRVATAGGKTQQKGEKDKPADDGPSAGSIIRLAKSSDVVVADAPGFIGRGDPKQSQAAFPVGYDADFQLFATDLVQPRILARLDYSVHVAKQSFGDAAPKNEIVEKSRQLF